MSRTPAKKSPTPPAARTFRIVAGRATSIIRAAESRASEVAGVATSGRVPTEYEIRELAYHKWIAAGSPNGDGINFWLDAERELTAR